MLCCWCPISPDNSEKPQKEAPGLRSGTAFWVVQSGSGFADCPFSICATLSGFLCCGHWSSTFSCTRLIFWWFSSLYDPPPRPSSAELNNDVFWFIDFSGLHRVAHCGEYCRASIRNCCYAGPLRNFWVPWSAGRLWIIVPKSNPRPRNVHLTIIVLPPHGLSDIFREGHVTFSQARLFPGVFWRNLSFFLSFRIMSWKHIGLGLLKGVSPGTLKVCIE